MKLLADAMPDQKGLKLARGESSDERPKTVNCGSNGAVTRLCLRLAGLALSTCHASTSDLMPLSRITLRRRRTVMSYRRTHWLLMSSGKPSISCIQRVKALFV